MKHNIKKRKGYDLKLFNLVFSQSQIGLFFLGVGITMFVINVTTIMNLYPLIVYLNSIHSAYSLNGYYISMISSLILIVYSSYNILVDND